jgi:internalin A
LPVPVEAERPAASLVRQLGGWYHVDAEGHIVEVNMVYHETSDKRRCDNDRDDTDQALRAMGAFPRLKRVFLKQGQATDDGLTCLAALHDLEVLMVWDASQISDAGMAHLAGLTKLTTLHFSDGGLGDASLQIFGRLPELRSLSLQGNSFSDDGLKHLAALKQLRSLWIGMNRRRITDAGAEHLMRLTELKELDVQGAQLSDALLAQLKQQRPGLRLYH